MAGETILVIDAGQDIEQKMTTMLEAEGYLVYTVTSHDVNAEMGELLKPSLIYIKPPDLSPTGLEPCKAVHGIPLLKNVPIVILASEEGPPGSNYSKDYGIADFLEPTFGQEELIEKTGMMLGKTPPSQPIKVNNPGPSPRPVKGVERKRVERKRFALPRPALGVLILVLIVGAGYLVYQRVIPTFMPKFMPTRKAPPSPAVKAPLETPFKATPPVPAKATPPVPSKAPEAGSDSQLPSKRNVANAPASAPPVPSKAPEAGSDSLLPSKKKVANAPAPALSVPSTPPVKPSSLSSQSAPQPPRKPFYSVQVGAFKNEVYAQALTKKFREKGYDAFTQPGVTKDKSPIYRVLVNKFQDRMTAKKLAEEIEEKEDIETSLYSE
jgi:cell division septation protein DedD